MNYPFLGRGWSFPPAFTKTSSTAKVEMLEQEDDISSSLEILLTTVSGERLMTNYGASLEELLFESLDSTMKALIADKIQSAILYFEPRIDIEKVSLNTTDNEGIVLIDLIYRVRATNSRFNFVYPYYIKEGTDINLTTTVNLLPPNN